MGIQGDDPGGYMVPRIRVFITCAWQDAYLASCFQKDLEACGADSFRDRRHIEFGDYIDAQILEASTNCTEQAVLMTPTAMKSLWVWMEIGLFWGARKRIVVLLHGISKQEFINHSQVPPFLKEMNVVESNDISSYFEQLKRRVQEGGAS